MPRKQKKAKSKLGKTIPTRVGVIAILFVIFVLGLYTMNKAIEIYGEMDSLSFLRVASYKNTDKNCRNRGFEGSAQIHSWYEKQGNEWILKVADEDLATLPLFENSKEYKLKNSSVKIIDLTPDLEQKLKLATKDNPVLVTITGYVHTCSGTPIACVEYSKDKISPYIK
jgi:hypothetical protein